MSQIGKLNKEIEVLESVVGNVEGLIRIKSDTLKLLAQLAHLDSVGAFINTVTGFVYTELANGDVELAIDHATHLDDIVDEWFSALSQADAIMVARVKFSLRSEASRDE